MYIIEIREWYIKHNKCDIAYLHYDDEYKVLITPTKEHAQKTPFKGYLKTIAVKYKYLITNVFIVNSKVRLTIIKL